MQSLTLHYIIVRLSYLIEFFSVQWTNALASCLHILLLRSDNWSVSHKHWSLRRIHIDEVAHPLFVFIFEFLIVGDHKQVFIVV
jgi:cytochrome c oxidase subunit IV